MTMKQWLALVGLTALIGLMSAPSWGQTNNVWTTAFEDVPAAGDAISAGDDAIRDLKDAIRLRGEVEMQFGDVSSDDNGLMRIGSARCYMQNMAPTALANSMDDYDNTDGAGVTLLTATPSNDSLTSVLGDGRCWIDTDGPDNTVGTWDDNTLYVWDSGTDAFVTGPVSPDETAPGVKNLIFNGSFNANAVGTAALPTGWSNASTGTLTTLAVAALTINTLQGFGNEFVGTANSANDGIAQTLENLKASTTYRVTAEAQPAVSGNDSCTLITVGAGTEADTTIATGAAYVTLSDTFVTDASAGNVEVILQNDGANDVCSWTHVSVHELSSSRSPDVRVANDGVIVAFASGSDGQSITAAGGEVTVTSTGTLTVTPPSPGYIILVDAVISAQVAGSGGHALTGRLKQDCGGGFVMVEESISNLADNREQNMSFVYANLNPTAGTECAYLLTAEVTVSTDTFTIGAGTETTSLRVVAMPVD